MTKILKERRDQLTYADGATRATCFQYVDGEIELSGFGLTRLTPKQARKFAKKILGWCDEIEKGN